MRPYYKLTDYLRETCHTKVYKLALSTGCTCPNRDGRVGAGGCAFCSEGGSGEFAAVPAPVTDQIREAKKRVDPKFPARIAPEDRRYIAYFQSFTNTYGDPARLETMFLDAARDPQIAAVSIGTRPDCLGPDIMAMLGRVNAVKPVWVELGLQTIHDETARRVNRGYPLRVFEEAYRRLKGAGFYVVVHLIFGFPGESEEDMMASVQYLADLSPHPDGVKLQLLHILRGTKLGQDYLRVLADRGGDEAAADRPSGSCLWINTVTWLTGPWPSCRLISVSTGSPATGRRSCSWPRNGARISGGS